MSRSTRRRGIGIQTAADSQERSQGQLHIYDGEGKGKSQAALGVVLRTIGLGICEERRTRVLLLPLSKIQVDLLHHSPPMLLLRPRPLIVL